MFATERLLKNGDRPHIAYIGLGARSGLQLAVDGYSQEVVDKVFLVPIQLKPYDNPARYNDSLASDDWDVGLAARDPTRADHLAYSAPFMEVDNGYVARPNAAPTSAEEVDKPDVRIAVAQGSAPHNVLKRLIKNAEIIPVSGGFEPAHEALAAGTADV
jgi:polar amino acid transport system substrate-binding protein